ncbi:MAG: hypothetical protein ABJC12_09055 [Saprospiraceae bacterium]
MSLLISQGCKHKDTTTSGDTVNNVAADTLPSDFVAFFDKFHEDSLFQLEHILFPLEGLPSAEKESDTLLTKRFFWQKEGWKKHNKFTDPSHQFTEWFEVINDRVIEHWIQMKGSKMFIHRRFAKLDDGWYLIYYAGLRPLNK